jgi:hypothetical protein
MKRLLNTAENRLLTRAAQNDFDAFADLPEYEEIAIS